MNCRNECADFKGISGIISLVIGLKIACGKVESKIRVCSSVVYCVCVHIFAVLAPPQGLVSCSTALMNHFLIRDSLSPSVGVARIQRLGSKVLNHLPVNSGPCGWPRGRPRALQL